MTGANVSPAGYEATIVAALERRPRSTSDLLRSDEVAPFVGSRMLTPTLEDMERRGLVHHSVGSQRRPVWHAGPAGQETLEL